MSLKSQIFALTSSSLMAIMAIGSASILIYFGVVALGDERNIFRCCMDQQKAKDAPADRFEVSGSCSKLTPHLA